MQTLQKPEAAAFPWVTLPPCGGSGNGAHRPPGVPVRSEPSGARGGHVSPHTSASPPRQGKSSRTLAGPSAPGTWLRGKDAGRANGNAGGMNASCSGIRGFLGLSGVIVPGEALGYSEPLERLCIPRYVQMHACTRVYIQCMCVCLCVDGKTHEGVRDAVCPLLSVHGLGNLQPLPRGPHLPMSASLPCPLFRADVPRQPVRRPVSRSSWSHPQQTVSGLCPHQGRSSPSPR